MPGAGIAILLAGCAYGRQIGCFAALSMPRANPVLFDGSQQNSPSVFTEPDL